MALAPDVTPGGFGSAMMNLVAVETDQPNEKQADGPWFEAMAPTRIRTQNLHEAQLRRRLHEQ